MTGLMAKTGGQLRRLRSFYVYCNAKYLLASHAGKASDAPIGQVQDGRSGNPLCHSPKAILRPEQHHQLMCAVLRWCYNSLDVLKAIRVTNSAFNLLDHIWFAAIQAAKAVQSFGSELGDFNGLLLAVSSGLHFLPCGFLPVLCGTLTNHGTKSDYTRKTRYERSNAAVFCNLRSVEGALPKRLRLV